MIVLYTPFEQLPNSAPGDIFPPSIESCPQLAHFYFDNKQYRQPNPQRYKINPSHTFHQFCIIYITSIREEKVSRSSRLVYYDVLLLGGRQKLAVVGVNGPDPLRQIYQKELEGRTYWLHIRNKDCLLCTSKTKIPRFQLKTKPSPQDSWFQTEELSTLVEGACDHVLLFSWVDDKSCYNSMNDLRLLLQADKERKIINLQFKQISNLQLMMPILSKFQNLESLSLNGNRLQNLPNDLSCLEKLIELDISNNLFRDIQEIMPALQTLPRLTHLMYSLKSDDEETVIKKSLPTLQRLNKKPLNTMAIVTKKQKERSNVMKLNEKDLEDIALIYDDIREVYKRNKYFVDKELADEFDKGVDNIMGDLSNKLNLSGVEEEVNSSIVSCKYALVDLCFVKLITYFHHFDRNIASILERIHDNMAESFRLMNDILKNSMDRSKAEIAQVALKKEDLYKAEIRRLKQMQEQNLSEIGTLQQKNAQLLDKMTKNSKNNILETTINNIIKRKGKSPAKGAGNTLKTKENGAEGMDNSDLMIRFNKSLSLYQLKDVITEIYASKNKHNAICADNGVPMETLQTHMYTFLNQKYGLKPITVEWAMSIVNGIKKYGHDDAEVAAFGKILRNELEEEFVQSLRKVKGIIKAATKKFKGEEPQQISVYQCEEILLICGYKREAIDIILNRIGKNLATETLLAPAQLEHLTLEYILKKHCEKIRSLCLAFRQVDEDEDGIINHQQLYVLVQKLNIKAEIDADELTDQLDPFRTNMVTFSHLVQNFQKMPLFKDVFTI